MIPLEFVGNVECGGKARGLAAALKEGIRIPKTYCIPVAIHKRFMQEGNGSVSWIRDHLQAALEILPESMYAVRSSSPHEDSSAHSFAGVFESVLNVKKEEIPNAILTVWNSVQGSRASSYTKDEHFMGVVIQPMIEAQLAGVLFSKNPSPRSILDLDTIVVEYTEGVGEKLVQGEVTPTTLIGRKEELTNQTPWMAELLTVIDTLSGDVDVEFVVDQEEVLWIVQQRPVSTKPYIAHLDLADYERRYKRELKLLDIQLLIEGCARYLPEMLHYPGDLSK